MKLWRLIREGLVWGAMIGLLIPGPAWASESRSSPRVVDVALQSGGVLLGQVVDPQGAAIGDVVVSLRDKDQELATAKTRPDGYFAFKGLRGGVYQLVAAKGQGVYRVWSPGTAPPAAQQGALLVSGDPVLRGQMGAFKTFLINPLVIAGVVATAVAVPVAIHNSQHKAPSS